MRKVMQLRKDMDNPGADRRVKHDWKARPTFPRGVYVVEEVSKVTDPDLLKLFEQTGKPIPTEVFIQHVGWGNQQLQTTPQLREDHPGHAALLAALVEEIDSEFEFKALCAEMEVQYESEVLDLCQLMLTRGGLDRTAFQRAVYIYREEEQDKG